MGEQEQIKRYGAPRSRGCEVRTGGFPGQSRHVDSFVEMAVNVLETAKAEDQADAIFRQSIQREC